MREWLGLDPERLSVTVYHRRRRSGAGSGPARSAFRRKISERLGEDENFWPANAPSQGPDGVCGPCSEIYYLRHAVGHCGNLEPGLHPVQPAGAAAGQPPSAPQQEHRHRHGVSSELRRCSKMWNRTFTSTSSCPIVRAAGEACGVGYEPESENGRRLRRIAYHVAGASPSPCTRTSTQGLTKSGTLSSGCCDGLSSTVARSACASRSCTGSFPSSSK